MRTTLIDVIRDTTTAPGLKHPLSQRTQTEIRDCLALISARQGEMAEAAGLARTERPVYADQPKESARKSVVVPLNPGASEKPSK